MSIEIKSDILAKELNQGIVPLGVPKAYRYDAALVEAARSAVNQGLDDVADAGATAKTDVNALGDKILAQMKHGYGYPFTAATAAAMADTTKIYVYTGSETGYTNGNWYYWNGTAWVSGGVYNATALETDKTLMVSGAAADSKTVGDTVLQFTSALESELPTWKYGYIDVSGNEKGGQLNIMTEEIIQMTVGGVISWDSGYVTTIHYFVNGYWAFLEIVDSNSITFDYPYQIKLTFRPEPAVVISDIDECASHIKIKNMTSSKRLDVLEKNIAKSSSDIDAAVATIAGESSEYDVDWEYGYINTDGTEKSNPLNIKTSKIIELGAGSSIVFSSASCSNRISYYDSTGSFKVGEQIDGVSTKTFSNTTYIKISTRPEPAVKIKDVPSAYSHITINRVLPQAGKSLTVNSNYWEGKKIVWFGTSIPAGVVNAGDSNGNGAYPTRLGTMLGATVYNESVGSSEVRGGSHGGLVSTDDPMGYGAVSAPGLLLSLSLSVAEKQEIIDNWDSKWKNIITWFGDRVDMSQTENYLNASWDRKLAKYLSGGSVGTCDLYVFDHGYNDGLNSIGYTELSDVPNDLTDRKYWIGAMGFLFRKILDDNPKARIILVGHYCTDGREGNFKTNYVCEAQEKLAKLWNLPIVKTWEHMGFSHIPINVNGAETTVAKQWMPDDVHPSSDTTGAALKHYANVLYPLIRDIR